jgi:hypothetical protein
LGGREDVGHRPEGAADLSEKPADAVIHVRSIEDILGRAFKQFLTVAAVSYNLDPGR